MKVAMLTAWLSRRGGGVSRVVRGLASQLQGGESCRVEVFGIDDEYAADDPEAWGHVPVSAFPVRGPAAFGFAPRLARALHESRPDLVHVHGLWMYPSVASLNWSRRAGGPRLISPQGMLDAWAIRNSRWKKRLAGWLYENRHLRGAACLHALCEEEARAIRAYGLGNPICVIPSGVDVPADDGGASAPWFGQVPESAKVLLYLGRLHPKKGLVNLLRAWSGLSGTPASDWRLVIAGWDQRGHERQLRRLAKELAITDRVVFVGPQFGKAKDAALRNARAFVLASFSEGLPIAVLEAWAYGLPVVMTPQCNLPQGFDVGAALRVEATAESVADGLTQLLALSDRELRLMGDRGRALVEGQFSWNRAASEMLAVYDWVLGGGAPPDCLYENAA